MNSSSNASAEMLLPHGSTNQSFASTSLLSSAPTTSAFRLINDQVGVAADSYALDIDSLPLEQLLQSEWFHQNISQMLNISVDNLTSLLINAQHQQTTNSSSMERDPMWLLVTLSTFYGLIFLAGLLGNLITCIVISRNKFMHTATNFYLFNLAVSDLILLLSGVPQELYNTWYPEEYPFNNILCKMEGIFSETAANATVLTITAFTVERYIAICHPFRQHTMSKLSRAIKFIFAIWVTAFLLALPQAMQFSVVPQNNGLACTMKNDFFAHVFAVSGFIFFGGPMTAICVLYVLIGVKLKRSRLLQAVPRRCYDVNRGISAQSRVIRMLVAVAVAFFLCWAPFHAQRLMAAYGSTAKFTSELFNQIYHILNYISGVLYFLSTCINPLLYNIMSHKFREAFKVTLVRQFGLTGTYQTQNHNYSALLRQNGSMRLHTTVNNNAFEHFNSYRVVQLQCRDPTHHLSLQDSIRTTTTTTTINSAGGYNGSGGGGGSNSCRSSHRNRCISVGSQTLLPSLSKPDVFATGANRTNGEHRMLQTQISQLSSVGDANSLLEADIGNSHHAHAHAHPTSYRLKELRRSLNASANGHVSGVNHSTGRTAVPDAECLSLNSQDWQNQDNIDNETDAITKPVAPQIMAATLVATQPIQPMNSIAELTVCQPSRSRLKLSRIISRRDRDALVTQTSPRVELMRKHLPGMGHQQRQHIPLGQLKRNSQGNDLFDSFKSTRARTTQPKATTKAFDGLAERFRWRTKRGMKAARSGVGGMTGSQRLRESSMATTSTSTPALMRIVYPATTVSTAAIMDAELERTNGNAGYATPKAL